MANESDHIAIVSLGNLIRAFVPDAAIDGTEQREHE